MKKEYKRKCQILKTKIQHWNNRSPNWRKLLKKFDILSWKTIINSNHCDVLVKVLYFKEKKNFQHLDKKSKWLIRGKKSNFHQIFIGTFYAEKKKKSSNIFKTFKERNESQGFYTEEKHKRHNLLSSCKNSSSPSCGIHQRMSSRSSKWLKVSVNIKTDVEY